MKKYLHVVNIGIQNTLVYRGNFLFRAVFGLIPLTATIFLWRAVYEGKANTEMVGAYSLAHMISYYLIVTVVNALTAVTEDDWQIAADIKDGNISQFLVKPIDYLTYRLGLFAAGRLIYSAVAAIPVALFILYQLKYFVPPANVLTFFWFCFSLLLTALLQFFTSFTMALLAFWVAEVSTFIFILFAFEYIAGGQLFPLDILPAWVAQLLYLTPFPYFIYFPVSVYLGQSSGDALWRGLAIQLFWVIASYVFARYVWGRGIRKYAAVGG